MKYHIQKLTFENDNKNNDLNIKTKKIKELKDEIDSLIQNKSNLIQKYEDLELNLKELTSEIIQLKTENDNKNKDLNNQSKIINEIELKKEEINEEREQLKIKNSKIESELNLLNSRIIDRSKLCNELENELKIEKNESKIKLNNIANQLNDSIEKLKNQNLKLEIAKEKIEKNNKSQIELTKKNDELFVDKANLILTYKKAKDVLDHLEEEKHITTIQIKKLQDALLESLNIVENSEKLIEAQKSQLDKSVVLMRRMLPIQEYIKEVCNPKELKIEVMPNVNETINSNKLQIQALLNAYFYILNRAKNVLEKLYENSDSIK